MSLKKTSRTKSDFAGLASVSYQKQTLHRHSVYLSFPFPSKFCLDVSVYDVNFMRPKDRDDHSLLALYADTLLGLLIVKHNLFTGRNLKFIGQTESLILKVDGLPINL